MTAGVLHYLDRKPGEVAEVLLAGWAIAPAGPPVTAVRFRLGPAALDLALQQPRPDVLAHYAEWTLPLRCGFELRLPAPPAGRPWTLEARTADGRLHPLEEGVVGPSGPAAGEPPPQVRGVWEEPVSTVLPWPESIVSGWARTEPDAPPLAFVLAGGDDWLVLPLGPRRADVDAVLGPGADHAAFRSRVRLSPGEGWIELHLLASDGRGRLVARRWFRVGQPYRGHGSVEDAADAVRSGPWPEESLDPGFRHSLDLPSGGSLTAGPVPVRGWIQALGAPLLAGARLRIGTSLWPLAPAGPAPIPEGERGLGPAWAFHAHLIAPVGFHPWVLEARTGLGTDPWEKVAVYHVAAVRAAGRPDPDYTTWWRQHHALTPDDLARRQALDPLARPVVVFRIWLLDDPRAPACALHRTAADVLRQTHPHRSLQIVSRRPGLAALYEPSRAEVGVEPIALWWDGLAAADYLVILRPGDEWEPDLLARWADLARGEPPPAVLYADEDATAGDGLLARPLFKPRWNRSWFLGHDYIGPARAVQAGLGSERTWLEWLRRGAPPAEGQALWLAALGGRSVAHLPRPLWHTGPWQPQTPTAADRARALEAAGASGPGELQPSGTRPVLRWRPHPRRPAASVSVLVPTRDGPWLRPCLTGLAATLGAPEAEVIVIDNGSVRPDTHACLRALPDRRFRVRHDPQAFHFGRLLNAAAAEARGDVLVLLNDDVLPTADGWWEELAGLALQEAVGAVGARLVYPDGRLQHGGVVLGLRGLAGHVHKGAPPAEPGHLRRLEVVHEVAAVTAACLAVDRTVFSALGGFDEAFAVAFNDVDLCLRLWAAGRRNLWTPFATLVHHESATRGAEDRPDRLDRFAREAQALRRRWAGVFADDPTYNPNLTLADETCARAAAPRLPRPLSWLGADRVRPAGSRPPPPPGAPEPAAIAAARRRSGR